MKLQRPEWIVLVLQVNSLTTYTLQILTVDIMAKESLKQQSYEKIKTMIISSQISPDHPITELELSKTLKVGRGPIREALNLLSKDGLIQLIPNKGGMIKKFSSQDLIQIYQIREALDPLAAKQAIGRIDISELENLERKLLTADMSNQESGRQFSKDLHSLIYRSCGNPYLLELFENLQLKDEVSWNSLWNLWSKESDSKTIEKRMNEHLEIIRCLKEKDAGKAEKISKEHISNAIQDILRMMTS